MSTKGLAIAMMGGGALFVYAGARGYSVLTAMQNVIQGSSPSKGQTGSLLSAGTTGSGSPGASGPIPVSGKGQLTYAQIEQYWIQAGGPPGVAKIAAAITEPESGRNPKAVQQGQPYATTGWGLWQITPGNSEPSIGIDSALLDPLTNARAAVAKYKSAGNSFRPWTTYTSGKYAAFLGST